MKFSFWQNHGNFRKTFKYVMGPSFRQNYGNLKKPIYS